jgi:hypothetical protein
MGGEERRGEGRGGEGMDWAEPRKQILSTALRSDICKYPLQFEVNV